MFIVCMVDVFIMIIVNFIIGGCIGFLIIMIMIIVRIFYSVCCLKWFFNYMKLGIW